MIEKDKLVELMQKYLQATKELYDYTTSEDLYVPAPCGFTVGSPIHMYCIPETYGSLSKLFDPGSSRVRSSAIEGACHEYATIGGIPIKIFWNAEEYEKICKRRHNNGC